MVLRGNGSRGPGTGRLRGGPRSRPAEPRYDRNGGPRSRRNGDGSNGFRRSRAHASRDESGPPGPHGFDDTHVAGTAAGPYGLDDKDVPPAAPGENGGAPADDDPDDGHDEVGHWDEDVRRSG